MKTGGLWMTNRHISYVVILAYFVVFESNVLADLLVSIAVSASLFLMGE